MIKKTVFICEKCNKQYNVAIDAYKCEATHLGLTLEDYQNYLKLLDTERKCGINVSIAKNERTEKLFDEAVNAVIKFQKEHNMEIL